MPTRQPQLNWTHLRNYTERFTWIDPSDGQRHTGFNPPQGARQKAQVPYFVRYVTGSGHLEQGEVITLKLDRRRHQRLVKFTASNQCRWLRDYLIISVDGIRFFVP